jgi:PAS domain S-box-containing protein
MTNTTQTSLKSNAHTQGLLERYRLILESMSEGVYGLDEKGHATFVNIAAESLTGWEASDLIGKSIHQFHHHSYENGCHYPQVECPIYQCLIDGRSRFNENEVFWRKDGSSFPVEYSATPILENGSITGAVVVFKDIRERKLAQENLTGALTQVQRLKERLQAENNYLQEEIHTEFLGEIIGQSNSIKALQQQITMVAPTDACALIQGENGTGKELVARALHRQSARSDRTMVKLNCGAISEGLIDSELFGHEKGAFTGAMQQRIGRFELAHGGTLFLDEVSELSLAAQVKLLRVLQEQEFERVGGTQTIKVDVRVIAASNIDLHECVAAGRFRMDLYYRLKVFPLMVPALRERQSDIPLLANTFAKLTSKKMGKPFNGIANESLKWLGEYSWPGNVRELQNRVEHAVILHEGKMLHIDPGVTKRTKSLSAAVPISLKDAEKAHIIQTLKHCQGVIAGNQGAAKLLDVPPSTLRSRMKKLGLV